MLHFRLERFKFHFQLGKNIKMRKHIQKSTHTHVTLTF